MAVELTTDSVVVDVTLSLDTSQYADGDVLADTQVVTNAMRKLAGGGVWQSLVVVDTDDQKQGMIVYLLDSNVSLGTENSAVSISDANAAKILAKRTIQTSDYQDLGGVSVACIAQIGAVVQAVSGSNELYVAVESDGTGTYTASGVVLRFGFLRD